MILVRPLPIAAGAAVVVAIGFGAITPSFASFSSRADSPGNSITAASDFRAPQVTAVAFGKASGGTPGFVKQGGGFFVYANVAADTGNPASGTDSVTVDASNFTTGASAVALLAGSYSAGGFSYNYRSASLLANASLAQVPSLSPSPQPTKCSTRPVSAARPRSTTLPPPPPTCRRPMPAPTALPRPVSP